MAVLQKIRVKFGLAISIIIALALLSFIIDPSTLESALSSMSSKYDVGLINGKAVSYTDFQAEVDNFATISEMTTGSSAHSEQEQAQIRNAAWQSLVDKYLFIKNAKAAGINVGDAEMVALTTGDMVSPLLANNYAFSDENGEFNPSAVVDFVQNIESDETGRLKAYWNYLQNSIYTQQFYAKYGSIFTNSDIQNPLMLQKEIEGNNNTANVDFVMIPFGYAPDTTVNVTSAEIKKYYNDHKDFYKQKASRDIEYVVYEVVPSEEDVTAVSESMTEIYDEFANAANMKNFLLKNSDRSLSDYWYREGELATINADVDAFVTAAKTGETSPVIKDGNTFYGVKVLATEMIPDSAYVKHILIQGDNAAALADSLFGVVKKAPASFSDVAALYSADKGSAADGQIGNIGWMTQTYMIPGFESVITAKIGEPFILDTQYGKHIVLVSQKSKPLAKKQVAIFEKTALASKETFNEFYAKANKFATIANGTYAGYKAAVDSLGTYSHKMNVLESTSSFGSVESAKEVTRWVFDNKPGKASNIITVNNNFFFVAAVKDAHKEGYATVEEVSSKISPILYNEKFAAKKAAEVAEKIAGKASLQEIADEFNASVNSQSDVAFAAMMAQSLDPALIGAIAAAPENKICGPVAGQYAVYVFQVTGRETGSFYTEDDAKNMAAQKAQYTSQMILPIMMDDADVKDNRARFY